MTKKYHDTEYLYLSACIHSWETWLLTPAIVLIPGTGGSLGLGETALHNAVERAVGADIT